MLLVAKKEGRQILKNTISIQIAISHNQTVINMFGFLGTFVKIFLLNVSTL